MTEPITQEQFHKFYVAYYAGDPKYKWLRFGQAFFYEFKEGMSTINDPELFYRENDKEAYKLIQERYVTT